MTPVFSIILGMGTVISVSLAFIIIRHVLGEKKTRKLLADFYGMAGQFNVFISREEVLGPRVIGFDDVSNKLLFFSKANGRSEGYLIDLADVKSTTVRRKYVQGPSHNQYRGNLEPALIKISLQIKYNSGGEPVDLDFYEKAVDPAGEVNQRAAKANEWHLLISDKLGTDRPLFNNRNRKTRSRNILS